MRVVKRENRLAGQVWTGEKFMREGTAGFRLVSGSKTEGVDEDKREREGYNRRDKTISYIKVIIKKSLGRVRVI